MLILNLRHIAHMTAGDLWEAVQADRKGNGCTGADIQDGPHGWKVYISRSRARHAEYIHLWREVEVQGTLPDGTATGSVPGTVHLLGRATQRIREMRPV